MKVKVIEQIDINYNDRIYDIGNILEVEEAKCFPRAYIHYVMKQNKDKQYKTMDWIPKEMVEVLSEEGEINNE